MQKYASDFAIPLVVAHIVAKRFPGYNDAKAFLFPDLKYLHDPKNLPDIGLATDCVIESLNNKEGILIYCHDDCDGYTSAAIMYKTLKDLSRTDVESIFVYPIIREKDGYILNPEVLRDYRRKGVKLIVTVDFGISSEENFRIAREEGLKLVVCDHHEINDTDFMSPAVAPKRPDSQYPFRELAGVGVSFKMAQTLYQKVLHLKPQEFYKLKKEFFPLIMIGTISDRVVLCGENRILCAHASNIFDCIDEPWIKYFREKEGFDVARITAEIMSCVASAAYIDPKYGVEILLSQDENYISETVAKLKSMISERRQGVELLFREALSVAKIFPNIIVSIIPFSKHHYLGRVTARLRDYYKRTSLIIGLKNGKCFGELRSDNTNLYELLYHLRNFFLDFGGHSKAAGFTMIEQDFNRFIDEVVKYVSNVCKSELNKKSSVDEKIDAFLHKSDVGLLKPLAPFGEGNPAPVLTDGISIYTIDGRFNVIEKGMIDGKS